MAPAEGWPARFSFDSVRVPLWLAWAGLRSEPAVQQAHRFWSAMRQPPPAWIDLTTDAVASYSASPGMVAVTRLAAAEPATSLHSPSARDIVDSSDYYSTVLNLLVACASQDIQAARG